MEGSADHGQRNDPDASHAVRTSIPSNGRVDDGPVLSDGFADSRNRIDIRKRQTPKIIAGLIGIVGLCFVGGCLILWGCQSGDRHVPAPARLARDWRPKPLPAPVKAIWVARFHYRYPEDIRSIMRNCAALGFNTVLWQVRGEATAAYPSRLEPWSAQFDYRDPGYDPLQIAVAEAHRHGLRLEAWINVMPGWKGPQPPPINNQLWHARPEWFLHDSSGRRQPLGDFYAILNPCLPEVRRYIAEIARELVSNYELDGIHLDYVRYAWETTPGARGQYPRDAATLRLFREETGRNPDDDIAAWDRWRAAQITRLVAEIRAVVRQTRPGTTLTAAVWASAAIGYRDYLQDGPQWLREGLVDALYPMAYTNSVEQFERNIDEYRAGIGRGRIVPGLGIYKHETPDILRRQLQRCKSWGGDFALFSYDSLHATAADRSGPVTPRIQALRQMRLEALRDH